MTHGFFSKFLPEETLSIMEGIQECSPVGYDMGSDTDSICCKYKGTKNHVRF
ncbi:hypothetical protein B4144_2505 [Bacillus atrophaeus]|nr:hypothetical protein B4144_2505 [Bacillus atrophaeus]